MDAFPEEIVWQAFRLANERCEECGKRLLWSSRGMEGEYGWEAHHKVSLSSNGSSTISNCKILCQSCHKKTRTYGQ